MFELVYYIKEIGNFSLDIIWFPLLIWTGCCALAFLFLQSRKQLNPLFHYHLRTAALLSLPLGIGISAIMSKIPDWFASSNIETAFFIVQNPIEVVPLDPVSASEVFVINWQEPSFFIGIGTVILALVSFFLLIGLLKNYLDLKTLYKNLSLTELEELKTISTKHSSNASVKLAFHDHPLVPFTFGWKQPVIVLPKILKGDPEKLNMALQHEMIHIKRGDYLLQLTLSVIESVFWFHPLIRYGNREIDTYREISCDQEVLSKTNISIKSYANLLYELVPLSTGNSRLSVSMAVKNSTLKKRIKTMKYHKLHKASFRQSIAFLMLMVVGITLPIACSDLRGPETFSYEELENADLKFNDVKIEINGQQVVHLENAGAETKALGAFIVNAGDYGIFKISPAKFENGNLAGSIEGNEANFSINELNVKLTSDEDILPDLDRADIWVQHEIRKVKGYSHGVAPASQPLEEFLSRHEFESNSENDEEVFVVVEQMPELIGGQAGLQSRVQYPTMARRAGIEGRVTVQFIVNENGDVENAQVVRGIGGGANEEALRVVNETKFKPGMQRGRPVRVQYSLSINFRLDNAEFSTDMEPERKTLVVNVFNNGDGSINGTVKANGGELLQGANVSIEGASIGTVTNVDGEFTIENLPDGENILNVSFVGYERTSICITGCN